MENFMTADDELFLFETFGKLMKQDGSPRLDDCTFPQCETAVEENDIPLSDFLFSENDSSECESPLDVKPSIPDVFFPSDFTEQNFFPLSPCDSPVPLFPNFPLEYASTPPPSLSPSLSPTSPCVLPFPFEPTSLLPPFQPPVQSSTTSLLRLETPPPQEEVSNLNWFEPQPFPSKKRPFLPTQLRQFPNKKRPYPTQQCLMTSSSSTKMQPPSQSRPSSTQSRSSPTQARPLASKEQPSGMPRRQSPNQLRQILNQSRLSPKQTRLSTTQTRQTPTQRSSESVQKHTTDCSMPVQPNRLAARTDADLATVHFIDLKDTYEKTQVRRGGNSEQRLVDCRIHMMAVFTSTPTSINVYVRRFREAFENVDDRIEVPVTYEVTLKNTQYFSVNLDAVYLTSFGNRFYQLSTTDRLRKNRFVAKCILTFEDGSSAAFSSEPFLLKSRKQSPNPRKKRSYKYN